MRMEYGEHNERGELYDYSGSDLESADETAAPPVAPQPARQPPRPNSKLMDWLTMPGQIIGYSYNGSSKTEIKASTLDLIEHKC